MPSKDITFSVAPDLVEKGLKIYFATFTVQSISRRQGSGLTNHIEEVLARIDIDTLLASPILQEYKRLQAEAGIADPVAPAEYLLRLIQKSGQIPNINRVVDCYNIVSAETLLSLGAHDLSYIKGNLELRTTDGSEKYTPLGKSKLENIAPGEYAAMDDEKIICRLDLKQCDETKCGKDTKEFLVYAQGNKETDDAYVLQGLQMVCDNMEEFCGAEYEIR